VWHGHVACGPLASYLVEHVVEVGCGHVDRLVAHGESGRGERGVLETRR
jgi:hypothetical protein